MRYQSHCYDGNWPHYTKFRWKHPIWVVMSLLFPILGYVPKNFSGIVEFVGFDKYYFIDGKKYKLVCWIGNPPAPYRKVKKMSVKLYDGKGIYFNGSNYMLQETTN